MSTNVKHDSVTLKLNSQVEGVKDSGDYFGNYTYNSSDKIVLYGDKNKHPERIAALEECSLLHSRIINIATDLIAGEIGFRVKGKEGHDLSGPDEERIEKAKEFYKAWRITTSHRARAYNLYSYGYAPQLLNFEVSENPEVPRKLSIASRPAREFRLGIHKNTFFGERSEHHYYSYFWHRIHDAKLQGFTVKTPKKFFQTKKLSERHVMRADILEDGIRLKDTKMGHFFLFDRHAKEDQPVLPKAVLGITNQLAEDQCRIRARLCKSEYDQTWIAD